MQVGVSRCRWGSADAGGGQQMQVGVSRCSFFDNIHEEPITFMPTYKRDSNSNGVYINKKEQCPSFTDRVLFKQNDKNGSVRFNEYMCRDQIFGSDHRPVFLDLDLKVA
jgi:hypothetical protein